MARKKHTGGTQATLALERAGIVHTLHPYEHDDQNTHFGDEAADVLGVEPERIFKTLVVSDGKQLAVAIVPVAHQLDLKAMAHALGLKKVDLADPAVAARSSGYVIGGISPIGQKTPLPTVLDESASGFATVFVSAGRRGLQVELAPTDLVALTRAQTAPIARA